MKIEQKEGSIAVWLGKFESENQFKKYIKIHYENEEPNEVDSKFEDDFNLKYYNRDIVEVKYFEEMYTNVVSMLEGFSYSESFQVSDKEIQLSNCIVVIYDAYFSYDDNEENITENELHFFANLNYEKVVDLSWMGL